MKKVYIKPQIIIEDFSLSHSISAGCEKIVTNPGYHDCGVPYGRVHIVFLEHGMNCTFFRNDINEYNDGFCYHVPSSEANYFNS